MNKTHQNVSMSLSELEEFEDKIKNNTANIEDYEIFESYLKSIGVGGVLDELLSNNNMSGIRSYYQKKISPLKRNYDQVIIVEGGVLGIVSALKKYLKNTL